MWMYVCVWAYTYEFMHVCMYSQLQRWGAGVGFQVTDVCVCLYVCVWVLVCVFMYAYECMHVCMYSQVDLECGCGLSDN